MSIQLTRTDAYLHRTLIIFLKFISYVIKTQFFHTWDLTQVSKQTKAIDTLEDAGSSITSLKMSYFVIVSTIVSQFYAFWSNSSLVNEFILLNRRSYNKKGIDHISVQKKNNSW